METFSILLALCAPVNSPHKGQWCGALMFSLICAWTNDWANNQERHWWFDMPSSPCSLWCHCNDSLLSTLIPVCGADKYTSLSAPVFQIVELIRIEGHFGKIVVKLIEEHLYDLYILQQINGYLKVFITAYVVKCFALWHHLIKISYSQHRVRFRALFQ